jgi:hypothetical protein
LLQVLALALELNRFFLVPADVTTFGYFKIELLQALDRLLHREHVRQQSTQPALVDVEHVAAGCLFGDRFLSLTFGADEQDGFALRGHFTDEPHRVFKEFEGFLQVDDVNTITFAKDVFLHLWIPALGLVPEVNASLEQFLHGN